MTHPGGRPLKFKSVEALQELIDSYFSKADLREEIYTITGLCIELDCDRDTLINYAKDKEFFGTIKRAKLKVENAIELHLLNSKNSIGALFNLKNNFGWKDKTEIDQSVTVNTQLDSQLIEGRQNVQKQLEEQKKVKEIE